MRFLSILIRAIFSVEDTAPSCSITTVSGLQSPQHNYCAGELIFEDNFDTLDKSKWLHENTMWGGGNWEFQWYSDDPKNSFVKDGNLHLRPTYTSDSFGEDFVYHGHAVIPADKCTNSEAWGCDRTASGDAIINPIRSAMLTTKKSFAFKYGTLEIRAKNPSGDWLWPVGFSKIIL